MTLVFDRHGFPIVFNPDPSGHLILDNHGVHVPVPGLFVAFCPHYVPLLLYIPPVVVGFHCLLVGL
jgi:hypothetical protein